MYIIDQTYFNGILNVPNVYEVNSDELDNLNLNIQKYVRLFLQEVLGFEKFEELDSYIIGGVLQPTAPQMWLDLVNGVEYEYNGKQCKWRGLKYTLGTSKVSLLAHFVYFNQYQTTINTGLGQVIVEPKNGINISPDSQLAQVYNEFVEMYQGSSQSRYHGIFQNENVLFIDYFGGNSNSGYVNLVQFFNHKKEVYEVNPPFLEYKNTFLS